MKVKDVPNGTLFKVKKEVFRKVVDVFDGPLRCNCRNHWAEFDWVDPEKDCIIVEEPLGKESL